MNEDDEREPQDHGQEQEHKHEQPHGAAHEHEQPHDDKQDQAQPRTRREARAVLGLADVTPTDVDDARAVSPEVWSTWTREAGAIAQPTLEELANRLAGTTGILLCTIDGYNLCSIGVDERGVGRLAALVSSLHAMSTATARAIPNSGNDRTDALSMTIGATRVVVTALGEGTLPYLLVIAANHAALGLVLLHGRRVAAELSELLPLPPTADGSSSSD